MNPVFAGFVVRGEFMNWEKCRSCAFPMVDAKLQTRIKVYLMIFVKIDSSYLINVISPFLVVFVPSENSTSKMKA